jgi:serine/threonine-protein kinase HipA
MSLAGAQDKLGVRFEEDSEKFNDSEGRSLTTHIVKPDTRQAKYQPSALNEYACMKLAKELKLPVPEVWLIKIPASIYVVRRYDRTIVQGNIIGLHQIDGCQLLGHGSGWKYERQGGLVSLQKIVAELRKLRVKAKDLVSFQKWVMFNYLIGNADAHAKNISLLISDRGYEIAPFYDLLCVRAYGDSKMALYIGDQDDFDSVGAHSWEAMCEDCGFNLAPTLKQFRTMATALMSAWVKVRNRINKQHPDLLKEERDLLEKMTAIFDKHTKAALSMTE